MASDPLKYPKCKYHASESVVVVANEEEEAELGPSWVDHPDFAKAKADQLASDVLNAAAEVAVKRGPGRPPKVREAE